MNKKVWFKILILGALVNLFAASAWACGESASNYVKDYSQYSSNDGTTTRCFSDAARTKEIDCNTGAPVTAVH